MINLVPASEVRSRGSTAGVLPTPQAASVGGGAGAVGGVMLTLGDGKQVIEYRVKCPMCCRPWYPLANGCAFCSFVWPA